MTIVADGPDGVWLAGLPQTVTFITVGQEFVTAGQKVAAGAGRRAAAHERDHRLRARPTRARCCARWCC